MKGYNRLAEILKQRREFAYALAPHALLEQWKGSSSMLFETLLTVAPDVIDSPILKYANDLMASQSTAEKNIRVSQAISRIMMLRPDLARTYAGKAAPRP